MDWDTTAMVLEDTMPMARGMLMPSPRPRLMLILTTLVDTMVDMAMA